MRRVYVPLLEEGRWPESADWLAQLQGTATRTEEALKAYCSADSRTAYDGFRVARDLLKEHRA
mgnify:CR=1 FL=1